MPRSIVLTTPPPSTRPEGRAGESRHLTAIEQRQVYEMLLSSSANGVLCRGAFAPLTSRFGCHWRTLSRLWATARRSILAGSPTAVTATKMKDMTSHTLYLQSRNTGTMRKRTKEEKEDAIKKVAHQDRETLPSLAAHSAIPTTTFIDHMKESQLKGKSSYVKPLVTQDNKNARIHFAFNFLQRRLGGRNIIANMHNCVHIDKKMILP
ncbi:Aste57867_24808 [Aphanomyces stellatus]|uniref:Aste57867_24808 protein n=1 Tax=Aphanomyces stellatus TaxID=120398 RepID=A0A485LRI2_9STRA|nr:hypothetical protein As57867_024730 [Aphanomyces stellatus]VFU01443.1 Aste57867_24808 [Aphanomyces stellatus]